MRARRVWYSQGTFIQTGVSYPFDDKDKALEFVFWLDSELKKKLKQELEEPTLQDDQRFLDYVMTAHSQGYSARCNSIESGVIIPYLNALFYYSTDHGGCLKKIPHGDETYQKLNFRSEYSFYIPACSDLERVLLGESTSGDAAISRNVLSGLRGHELLVCRFLQSETQGKNSAQVLMAACPREGIDRYTTKFESFEKNMRWYSIGDTITLPYARPTDRRARLYQPPRYFYFDRNDVAKFKIANIVPPHAATVTVDNIRCKPIGWVELQLVDEE